MKEEKFFLSVLLMIGQWLFAQHNLFQHLSEDGSLQASFNVGACKMGTCYGKSEIKILDKKTNIILQNLTSKDLVFEYDPTQNPEINIIKLNKIQTPVKFEDFNFDGKMDIAVRNGNNGYYGDESYDIYLYQPAKKQFVLDKDLSNLTIDYIGLCKVDQKRKRLMTYNRQGCCINTVAEFTYGKNLMKVYEKEENPTTDLGKYVTVTVKNLIGGKWKTTVAKYDLADYYKNNTEWK